MPSTRMEPRRAPHASVDRLGQVRAPRTTPEMRREPWQGSHDDFRTLLLPWWRLLAAKGRERWAIATGSGIESVSEDRVAAACVRTRDCARADRIAATGEARSVIPHHRAKLEAAAGLRH